MAARSPKAGRKLDDSTSRQVALLEKELTRGRTKRVLLFAGAGTLALAASLAFLFWGSDRAPAAQQSPRAPAPPTPPNPAPHAAANAVRKSPAGAAAASPPSKIAPRVGPFARLDPTELAKSIAQDKTGAIQLCYERELKRDPHLRGKVVVGLDLRAPHAVTRVKVKDNLHRTSFTRCVQGAMRSTYFPDLSEDLSIEIPFVLKSPDF